MTVKNFIATVMLSGRLSLGYTLQSAAKASPSSALDLDAASQSISELETDLQAELVMIESKFRSQMEPFEDDVLTLRDQYWVNSMTEIVDNVYIDGYSFSDLYPECKS